MQHPVRNAARSFPMDPSELSTSKAQMTASAMITELAFPEPVGQAIPETAAWLECPSESAAFPVSRSLGHDICDFARSTAISPLREAVKPAYCIAFLRTVTKLADNDQHAIPS